MAPCCFDQLKFDLFPNHNALSASTALEDTGGPE